jgi:hypothetical protein
LPIVAGELVADGGVWFWWRQGFDGSFARVSRPKKAIPLDPSAAAYAMWGAATQGWMMFAIIGATCCGTVAASNSLISSADSQKPGSNAGCRQFPDQLNSRRALMVAAPLLVMVEGRTKTHKDNFVTVV